MAINNTVPSVDSSIKTLAFPFQRGASGFPAMASPENYAFTNIVALIMTGKTERVMEYELGVGANEFVFENMTPIQQIRLANMVATAIEQYIPNVRVNSIIPSSKKYEVSGLTGIVFDIVYTVAGQSNSQQVIYTPTSQGL